MNAMSLHKLFIIIALFALSACAPSKKEIVHKKKNEISKLDKLRNSLIREDLLPMVKEITVVFETLNAYKKLKSELNAKSDFKWSNKYFASS